MQQSDQVNRFAQHSNDDFHQQQEQRDQPQQDQSQQDQQEKHDQQQSETLQNSPSSPMMSSTEFKDSTNVELADGAGLSGRTSPPPVTPTRAIFNYTKDGTTPIKTPTSDEYSSMEVGAIPEATSSTTTSSCDDCNVGDRYSSFATPPPFKSSGLTPSATARSVETIKCTSVDGVGDDETIVGNEEKKDREAYVGERYASFVHVLNNSTFTPSPLPSESTPYLVESRSTITTTQISSLLESPTKICSLSNKPGITHGVDVPATGSTQSCSGSHETVENETVLPDATTRMTGKRTSCSRDSSASVPEYFSKGQPAFIGDVVDDVKPSNGCWRSNLAASDFTEYVQIESKSFDHEGDEVLVLFEKVLSGDDDCVDAMDDVKDNKKNDNKIYSVSRESNTGNQDLRSTDVHTNSSSPKRTPKRRKYKVPIMTASPVVVPWGSSSSDEDDESNRYEQAMYSAGSKQDNQNTDYIDDDSTKHSVVDRDERFLDLYDTFQVIKTTDTETMTYCTAGSGTSVSGNGNRCSPTSADAGRKRRHQPKNEHSYQNDEASTVKNNNFTDKMSKDSMNESTETRDTRLNTMCTFMNIPTKNVSTASTDSKLTPTQKYPYYRYHQDNDEYYHIKRKSIIQFLPKQQSLPQVQPPQAQQHGHQQLDDDKRMASTITPTANNSNELGDVWGVDDKIAVNLWQLREFALTKGGLLNSGLRKRSWPLLASLDSLIINAYKDKDNCNDESNKKDSVMVHDRTEVKNQPQYETQGTKMTLSSSLSSLPLETSGVANPATGTTATGEYSIENASIYADTIENFGTLSPSVDARCALTENDLQLLDYDLRNKKTVERFVLFHVISTLFLRLNNANSNINSTCGCTSISNNNDNASKAKQECNNNNSGDEGTTASKSSLDDDDTRLGEKIANVTTSSSKTPSDDRHPTITNEAKITSNSASCNKNQTNRQHFSYYPGLADLAFVIITNLEKTTTAANMQFSKRATTKVSYGTLFLERLAEVHLKEALLGTAASQYKDNNESKCRSQNNKDESPCHDNLNSGHICDLNDGLSLQPTDQLTPQLKLALSSSSVLTSDEHNLPISNPLSSPQYTVADGGGKTETAKSISAKVKNSRKVDAALKASKTGATKISSTFPDIFQHKITSRYPKSTNRKIDHHLLNTASSSKIYDNMTIKRCSSTGRLDNTVSSKNDTTNITNTLDKNSRSNSGCFPFDEDDKQKLNKNSGNSATNIIENTWNVEFGSSSALPPFLNQSPSSSSLIPLFKQYLSCPALTRHEQRCLYCFLELLRIFEEDRENSTFKAIQKLCLKYNPTQNEQTGFQCLHTIAMVVGYYTSTWFVTSMSQSMESISMIKIKYQLQAHLRSSRKEKNEIMNSLPSNYTNDDCKVGAGFTTHDARMNTCTSSTQRKPLPPMTMNHSTNSLKISSRLVDFFLVCHPLMPVYFAVALLQTMNRRQQYQGEQCQNLANNQLDDFQHLRPSTVESQLSFNTENVTVDGRDDCIQSSRTKRQRCTKSVDASNTSRNEENDPVNHCKDPVMSLPSQLFSLYEMEEELSGWFQFRRILRKNNTDPTYTNVRNTKSDLFKPESTQSTINTSSTTFTNDIRSCHGTLPYTTKRICSKNKSIIDNIDGESKTKNDSPMADTSTIDYGDDDMDTFLEISEMIEEAIQQSISFIEQVPPHQLMEKALPKQTNYCDCFLDDKGSCRCTIKQDTLMSSLSSPDQLDSPPWSVASYCPILTKATNSTVSCNFQTDEQSQEHNINSFIIRKNSLLHSDFNKSTIRTFTVAPTLNYFQLARLYPLAIAACGIERSSSSSLFKSIVTEGIQNPQNQLNTNEDEQDNKQEEQQQEQNKDQHNQQYNEQYKELENEKSKVHENQDTYQQNADIENTDQNIIQERLDLEQQQGQLKQSLEHKENNPQLLKLGQNLIQLHDFMDDDKVHRTTKVTCDDDIKQLSLSENFLAKCEGDKVGLLSTLPFPQQRSNIELTIDERNKKLINFKNKLIYLCYIGVLVGMIVVAGFVLAAFKRYSKHQQGKSDRTSRQMHHSHYSATVNVTSPKTFTFWWQNHRHKDLTYHPVGIDNIKKKTNITNDLISPQPLSQKTISRTYMIPERRQSGGKPTKKRSTYVSKYNSRNQEMNTVASRNEFRGYFNIIGRWRSSNTSQAKVQHSCSNMSQHFIQQYQKQPHFDRTKTLQDNPIHTTILAMIHAQEAIRAKLTQAPFFTSSTTLKRSRSNNRDRFKQSL